MTLRLTWLLLVLPLPLCAQEPIPEGEYFTVRERLIRHRSSGKCLSLDSNYQHSGNLIYLYDCNREKGYDTYKLVNYDENEWYIKFLYAPGHQSYASWACVRDVDKSHVSSQSCSKDAPNTRNYAHQRWSFINTGDFRWLIRNVESDKCMRPSSHEYYAEVKMVACDEKDREQHWDICNLKSPLYCDNLEHVIIGSQALCCGIIHHGDATNRFKLLTPQCEKRLKNNPAYCNTENIKPVLTNI